MLDSFLATLDKSGVCLNPPCSADSILRLQNLLDQEIDKFYVLIMTKFNGFCGLDFDPDTEFRIWTIEESIMKIKDRKVIEFCDFSNMAEIYAMEFTPQGWIVVDTERRERTFSSVRNFFELWEKGDLSF